LKKIFSYCAIPVTAMFGLYLGFASSTVYAGDVNKIYKETCESRTDAQMKESMTNGTKNPNYVKLSDLGVDLADLDALIIIVRGFCK